MNQVQTDALVLDTAFCPDGPREEDAEGRFVLKAIALIQGHRFETQVHIPREHPIHVTLAKKWPTRKPP